MNISLDWRVKTLSKKFVFQKLRRAVNPGVCRIDSQLLIRLQEVSKSTGISITTLASTYVEYGLDNTEVKSEN
jgi:hypothetical protein